MVVTCMHELAADIYLTIVCVIHTFSYVTRPTEIDHVSANYTKLYFANIFRLECSIPFS